METIAVPDEIEVKFPNTDLAEMRQRLHENGARLKTQERLMRRIVFGGEANPDMVCTYGRVRDEGDIVTMSAKYSAVNGDIGSQGESQIVVDSFEQASAILLAFGLTATDYQENKRETWQLGDGTLVELEQWPELPTYIEIEGGSIADLKTAASSLGLDWDTHTTDSTDKLYAQHFGLSAEDTRIKLKDLRFPAA